MNTDGVARDSASTTIVLGDGVEAFVAPRGGVVNLSRRCSRCCSGTLVFLDADVSTSDAAPALRSWSVGAVEVRLVTPMVSLPSKITIEMRGRRRPKLVALQDGCAYRL
ncbi:MAG TPA: hypothetical protein VMV96_04035 [Acidimicrobiales bacterium]|nr:hypothetical protein [Acidimicrobiales bacterium]